MNRPYAWTELPTTGVDAETSHRSMRLPWVATRVVP